MASMFPTVEIEIKINKKPVKRTVTPELVEETDESFLDQNQIKQFNRPYWWYRNKEGQRTFLKYRVNDLEDPTNKKFQYMSKANGRWYRKNLFDHLNNQHGIKKDLYLINHLLVKNPDTVDVAEGENTCEVAQEKFPNLFFTTFGSAGDFKGFDWTVLKDKKVFLHHDVEKTNYGRDKFRELCLYLIDELGIDAKVVPYPSFEEINSLFLNAFTKNGWGLEDTIPEEINIHGLREQAYVPERPEVPKEIKYSDIRKALDEWVYVRGTGNSYYERRKRKLVEQSEVNNLFLRAKARGDFNERTAHEYFQKNDIDVVDGITYYPQATEYIYRGENVYLNKYIPPQHEDMGDVPRLLERIDWFIKLVNYTCEYEEYESGLLIKALACAVQYPDENRTWCILISSLYHGTGKGLLFKVIHYLLGKDNCIPLDLPTLNNKFNGWFLQGNNVFITEANNKGKEDSHTIGSLKNLLTEDYFQVELKGKERVNYNCHFNLYLSTNEVKPYTTEKNDRRHLYVRHELQPLSDEFYEDIKFNKIDRRDNDKSELALVAHYLKYVYKITREECQQFYGKLPKTKWHYLLLEESLTGYMQELWNVYEQKLIPSFHWELYNIDQIYSELSKFIHNDTRNKDHMLSSLPSKDRIKKFLRSINCVTFRARRIVKNGKVKFISDAIEPTTDKNHKPRGHYWIDPNHVETWKDNRDIFVVNKHFNDPLIYARAHRDPDKHYREERYNPHMHVGDLLELEEQSKDFPY